MQLSSSGLPARPAETLPGPSPSPSIPTPRVAGFGGKSSKGRILAAVCCANLVLLCAAFYFGATHRGEVPLQGKELEFHHIRTTLSKHPELTFQEVLPGVDLVLELYGVSSQEAETTIIKDKVVHLHTASRQALLNFSFSSAGAAVAVDGFYFTVFLSSQKVEVWNFTRFCWDLTSEVEHLSEHGEGQEVLLQDPHRPNGEGFPSRSRATTFFFQTAEHFLVSITKGDDLSNGMDLFFSGENLVGSICEASGELKHGMYVEIIRGEYRGYRGTVDISNGQFKVKLVNGTKLQVGEMYCRPLEEDVHWVEKEWQEEHLHGQRCEGLVDVERTCSKDGCTVLLAPEEVSCESFCEAHHLHCNEAWASHKDSCETSAPAPCAAKMSLRGEQLLCRCQPMTLSRLGQEVHLGAHVLLNSRAAVVTKVPDRHGHLEVETPELVTLNTPSFEPHNHSHGSESHTDSSKDHHASCEEVKQGEEVRFTAGKFKGHLGAMMSCDPVSQEYRVMLSQHIRVHAFDVRVVHCETLKYFGQSCSHDHCELAPSETADSCQDFCNGHDLRCLKAWIHDSHSDSSKRCAAKRTLVPCDHPGGLHNKLCECTPHVFVDDCFQKGVSFSPQNMEGQFRSHEPSASACAHRCASVVGCAHFSFWTDGGCHLQDVQGKMEERPGVTSGPPDCLAPSILATPVAADFSKTESSRCEEGISYRPLDMYGELRTKEPSLNDCALRCHRVDGCVHFSYWLDGGCHLQDGKASKKGTLGAISGPANGCRQELESKGEVTEAVPVVPQRPRWSSDKPSPDLSPSNEAVTLSLARPCANLVDVQTLCSATQDSCKVMVHGMSRRSCFDYCEQQSLRCISTTSRCHGGEEVGCEIITGSNLMACHCEAPSHRNDAPEVEESWKFHCHGDQLGWSREKRWWCCRELEIGCEGMRSWQHANCTGTSPKLWSQDKKDLCCRQQGICQVGSLRQRQQVLKNVPPVPQIPFMMQGYRASPMKTTSKVMRWLTRKGGVFVLCLLAGVALLSLLPLLCRSKESVASKEGYLPVATQES